MSTRKQPYPVPFRQQMVELVKMGKKPGELASRKRMTRLMRTAQIRGFSRRRGFIVTTEKNHRQRPAPDLVNRQFIAQAPNQL